MRPGVDVVVIGADKALKRLEASKGEIRKETLKALRVTSQLVRKEIVMLSTNRLARVRSGLFRSSIQANVNEADLSAAIGTGVIYARMLEEGTAGLPGGRLLPKQAKFIAVPLSGSPARTEAGVGKRPRNFADTFVARRPNEPPVIYLRGNPPKPLFVLLRSVRIEGRHIFRAAFTQTKDAVGARFNMGITTALTKE